MTALHLHWTIFFRLILSFWKMVEKNTPDKKNIDKKSTYDPFVGVEFCCCYSFLLLLRLAVELLWSIIWCCHCLFSLAFVYKCPEHLLLWLAMVCNYRWPSKWVDNKRNWRIGRRKELRLRLFSNTIARSGRTVWIAAFTFNPIWNWEVNDEDNQ